MKRQTFFSAMMAALLPIPVVAFDTGARGMEEAESFESQHTEVAIWAISEFLKMESGFRQMLDPIYPQPQGFNIIDAQIADIVAQGQLEHDRLIEAMREIDSRLTPESQESPQGASVNESLIIDSNLTEIDTSTLQSFTPFGEMEDIAPAIDVISDDGTLLSIDTSDGVDLPNLTIDPRDGGTYESEIKTVDDALDIVQLIQDQVPAPIQSKGDDLYNSVVGTDKPDEHS